MWIWTYSWIKKLKWNHSAILKFWVEKLNDPFLPIGSILEGVITKKKKKIRTATLKQLNLNYASK